MEPQIFMSEYFFVVENLVSDQRNACEEIQLYSRASIGTCMKRDNTNLLIDQNLSACFTTKMLIIEVKFWDTF